MATDMVPAHVMRRTSLAVSQAALGALAVSGLAGIGIVVLYLQTRGTTIQMFGVVALVLATITAIRPAFGLAVLVLAAIAIRVKIGTGTGSPLVASLGCGAILCASWLAHRLVHRRRIILLDPHVALPALSLLGWTLFSMLWGRATLDPRITLPGNFLRVQFGAVALIAISLGLLFVGADLFSDRRIRLGLMGAIVLAGACWLALEMIDFRTGFLGVSGLFGAWFVAVCWANGLCNRDLPIWLRWCLSGLALIWLAKHFIPAPQRTWVSGWLPPLVALIVITAIVRPRLGLVLSIASSLFLAGSPALLASLLAGEQSQGSLGGDFGRTELAERGLAILHDRLLFGTGPAGYAPYFMTFVPDQAMSMHNNYLDILAQAGIFGLLSLLLLLVGLGRVGFRLLRSLPQGDDRAACIAALGGLGGIAVGMALGDWVIPFVYNQTIAGFDHSVYTWLMLAMLCGLVAQARSAPEEHV